MALVSAAEKRTAEAAAKRERRPEMHQNFTETYLGHLLTDLDEIWV